MVIKIKDILNESSINIPNEFIDQTMSIIINSVVNYLNRFYDYSTDQLKQYFPDYENNNLTIVNPEQESFTFYYEFNVELDKFDYSKSKDVKYNTKNNIVTVRIETTFNNNENDSLFHVVDKESDTKITRFRFGLYSLANVIMDVLDGKKELSKIYSSLKLLKSTVKHEWGHFVQSFIFPKDQLDMKSDYSDHGIGYYTSLSELAPMLESAKGEFEVIVTDNEFWKELSRDDKIKFVKQFVGMDNDDKNISVQGKSIKLPSINPHKLFISYRKNNPVLYKKVVKKFTNMISNLLN